MSGISRQLEDTSGIVAPPPLLYVGAFLSGMAIHTFLPLSLLSAVSLRLITGITLSVGSGLFVFWALLTMRRFKTTISPYRPSTAIVMTGPYRLSRNPIYIAMTGLYAGVAFLLNSVCPLLILPLLLFVMHHGVILREERYLSLKFSETYDSYKSKVRRWL